jgi:Electron transfer DM13
MKKNYFLVVLLWISIVGCTKHNTPVTPLDDLADSSAVIKYSGEFMDGPYGRVSGGAVIYLEGSQFKLALENTSISNGPDLHVYLSREVQPVNYIDLGLLRSTGGNQLYTIPGMPDFTDYKYALIHCQRFNHLFGSAAVR